MEQRRQSGRLAEVEQAQAMQITDDGQQEDSAEFEVEAILGEEDGMFQVKWKGFPESEATWEPEATLCADCPQLVSSFREQAESKRPRRQTSISSGGRGKRAKHDIEVCTTARCCRTARAIAVARASMLISLTARCAIRSQAILVEPSDEDVLSALRQVTIGVRPTFLDCDSSAQQDCVCVPLDPLSPASHFW